ncbi:MAG: TetR/AcrR family transcriptional regulator [Nocardiopsis sp. BM-2018]|nr:MAG: TetR/AcrR family transcriptional regulator [Nocardiopsis sp. BM-2018]
MAPHERRDDLIRTALRVFARRPPGDVTPEEIAEEADVSRALVYRYFPNMAELRKAALEQAMAELMSRLAPPENLPPLEQLRVALRTFIDFAESYAALLNGGSVISTEETEAEIDRVREGVRALILQRTGVESPSPKLLLSLRCWVSAVETAVMFWLRDQGMSREELADWLLDQLMAMLTAAGGPREELDRLAAHIT